MHRFDSVRLEGVSKVFGRHPALIDVSFTLHSGELSLLVGPNGAGKSTLLAILSTLSRPTEGRVQFGDCDHHTAEQTLRGRIGLLAHQATLYERLSGRENLEFFARLYGVAAPQQTVERWLLRVGMDHAAHRPVGELSQGMKQRLALARALLPDPDFVLLDEPFNGLDHQAVGLLCDELDAARRAGKLLLVVSHDLDALDGRCDHLLVLKRGRLAQELHEPGLSQSRILECYRAVL